jgi:hypothetical protein
VTSTSAAAIDAAIASKRGIPCKRRTRSARPPAQLGPQVIALVVVLTKQLGLSFGKIVTLLQQRYGLTVTRSGLVHAVHRAARQARPTYDALVCAGGRQPDGEPR